jgi:hypothetical protein
MYISIPRALKYRLGCALVALYLCYLNRTKFSTYLYVCVCVGIERYTTYLNPQIHLLWSNIIVVSAG